VFPGGGTPDMQQLLQQAQQMQQQLMDAQERLAQTKVEGSAGGGLVTATVTGTGELTGLTIDPQAVDADDTETLADLILAAVRDATNNANDLQAQTMGPLAGAFGGMGGPDLSGPGGLPGLPGQ